MTQAQVQQVKFSDADIVNLDDFIPATEYNPHNIHPFLFHDHGFVLGVVFAPNLQDALDIMVDENKLDRYLIEEAGNTPGTKGLPAADYPTLGTENEEGITRLGNASEPFDLESLGIIELQNPKRSFVAEYLANFPASKVD